MNIKLHHSNRHATLHSSQLFGIYRFRNYTASIFPVCILLVCTLLTPIRANAIEPDGRFSETENEWFYSDDFDATPTDHVSEGELRFLEPITDKRVLTTEVTLNITEDSMLTGLVDMKQCYSQLDPVPAVDILYSFDEIDSMSITSSRNIGTARLNGHALQLENVMADGTVCVKSRIRVLDEVSADNFEIRYGPYYRRFLDGFYPYHVILNVNYPASVLKFHSLTPGPEKNFQVAHATDRISIDTWFEGILMINMRLVSKQQPD